MHRKLLISIAVISLIIGFAQGAVRPIVLMHGIVASASSMDPVVAWIQAAFPGTYVKNVEIGDGEPDSIIMPMQEMVTSFCQQLAADANLGDSINLIGYSQGGLVARAYIQQCNSPKVHNFITWSSPHGGQFGVPFTGTWVDPIVGQDPYDPFVQEHFSFAQYWRDPYQLPAYMEKCVFLPSLNNLVNYTDSYKQNMMSLANFVLLYSTNDTIIKPQQSGWFSAYAANSTAVIPLQEQADIWGEDLLGLQTLSNTNRLHFVTNDCKHQDYPTSACEEIFNMYTLPWLNNTETESN